MIQYKVSFDGANQHLLMVELSCDMSLESGQMLWLPDWLPGSYMIRDFSKNIQQITATSQGKPCQLVKQGKSTWRLMQSVDGLRLKYAVYAWDLSVRTAHFDQQHCFFNGSSLFIAIKGLEKQPHHLELLRDSVDAQNNWRVATTMNATTLDDHGFGRYCSKDYAELIDHPFEIADFIQGTFSVAGVKHQMVFTEAPANIDIMRISADVQIICEQISQMYDDSLPFERYCFLTLVLKKGFGGLEHRCSTALHCSRSDLPLLGENKAKKPEGYKTFLALCSHEYFHAWNVKRIKPKIFKDYQLQQPAHTPLLWFFEGVTSYYDELMLLRSGVITNADYLTMLAKHISGYLRGAGRHLQTISESSFDAWTKFYQQDENAANGIVSYYVKGGLIAMLLDFEIRQQTNNCRSLDDLMRLLWKRFGKVQRGVEDDSIQQLVSELCGVAMDDFFHQVLTSTSELPLADFFAVCDIRYQLFAESKMLETGGFVEAKLQREENPSLMISHKPHAVGAEVITVFHQGCGSKFGISNKDVIIAINDLRVGSTDLDQEVAQYPLGESVKVSFFRRDKLQHCQVILESSEKNTCFLSFNKSAPTKPFKDWVANSTRRLNLDDCCDKKD